jgi:hypothetical protein
VDQGRDIARRSGLLGTARRARNPASLWPRPLRSARRSPASDLTPIAHAATTSAGTAEPQQSSATR